MDQLNKQLSLGILPNELCFNEVNSGYDETKLLYIKRYQEKNFMGQSFLKSGSMKNYFIQLLNQYQIMLKIIMYVH